MTRPTTRPEEVLALPLLQHSFRGNVILSKETVQRVECESDGEAAALATVCNAYPLALALAEACALYLDNGGFPEYVKVSAALSAFLAHRKEADRG